MTDDLETRRKRLIYRSNYRGFKEADILLGGFAKAHGPSFTAVEIEDYEALIAEYDHDIYDWVIGQKPVPERYDTPLFARLQAYAQKP